MDKEQLYREVAADLVELVARTTASMSPAERAVRLDPVLMKAALRPAPLDVPLAWRWSAT
jgi:hypothetical protein